MVLVGRLLKFIEPRYLVLSGLILAAYTLNLMVDFTDQTSSGAITYASIIQGFGLGLVFVPLSTVAFATLPDYLRTDGTAVLTLVRNIGSSIGISLVIAQLTSMTIRMHAHFAEFITPFNNALQAPDVSSILNMSTDAGRALTDQLITQQASIVAYANDFKVLMYLTIAVMPLVFIIKTGTRPGAAGQPAAAHAMD
jgi:DHA2 family multidrug resistance protein